MKQIAQSLSSGAIEVAEVPVPRISPTEVLVATRASVISPGTETAMTSLGEATLIQKARQRPDLVRKVVDKARRDGLSETLAVVRSRLSGYMPLGYSDCGVVLEVGEMIEGIEPGQLVATGGRVRQSRGIPGRSSNAVRSRPRRSSH